MIKIEYTDAFSRWFAALPEIPKGRVIGAIEAFEHWLDEIAEPHGCREIRSRHSPHVFVLYPAREGMAFVVFCVLGESTIYLIWGYDANAWLDQLAQIRLADDIIDQCRLLP